MGRVHAWTGLGAIALPIATAFLIISGGFGRTEMAILGLGVAAGWLRFRLTPAGSFTLSPIAFFFGLLLINPWTALSISVISTFLARLTTTFLARPTDSKVALAEAFGTSAIDVPPAAGAVAVMAVLSHSTAGWGEGLIAVYASAVATYIALRLIVDATQAYLHEGIGIRSYLQGAALASAGNLLFIAAITFGLRAYLYDQLGLLAPILITIALVEIYHPWKLLSDQEEILLANLAMVAQAIDLKDPYTASHSRNVAKLAVRIARAMGLPEREVRKIQIGALMHDIGKVGVSVGIIRKPGRLSAEEERLMRAHPVMSADIMQPIQLLADASEIVRLHHEHWDGTGYPDGLKGEEIPIGSRVILVADAFDAMTTDRPYRRGRSRDEALRVLKEHAGRQFDQRVVDALEDILTNH